MDLLDEFQLIDIWRERNQTKKRFTWRQKQPRIQSRLDYILLSNTLVDYVQDASILPAIYSDHSPISVHLKCFEMPKGNGIWKFNNSLLKHPDYVNDLRDKIEAWKNEYDTIDDKTLVWELIKFKIREFTIAFSKSISRQNRAKESKLIRQIDELEKLLDVSKDSNVLWLEYEVCKAELRLFSENKIRGQIIRSRIKWTEEYETSSALFLGLEKSNYVKKNINKLKIDNVDTTDPNKILNHISSYYKTLYEAEFHDEKSIESYFDSINEKIPKLSNLNRARCDNEINLIELETSLNAMKTDKTPGNDGLTVEFYRQFWQTIKHSLLNSFQYSQNHGLLSTSQRQAVLSLLEKKGKSRFLIRNWRPISLLNVDYKILTKCLAERMKTVMPDIIHHNQTGFIKGRNISEGIRAILDILTDTSSRNIGGLIMTIDFEKAFDSVDFQFLFKAISKFNFGPIFQNWISIFYNEISSCVINNNVTSTYFPIKRGVRQGDPLSPLLFILVIEIFNIKLRNSNKVNGLRFGEEEIKVLGYADDMTAILPSTGDAKELLILLKDFKNVSGLKVNKEKCEGLWLGRFKANKEKPLGIKWQGYVKILGIYISYDLNVSQNKNFEEKILTLKSNLRNWQRRHLTHGGKILIIKTFGISQIMYLCSVLKIPDWAEKEINEAIFRFLWNGKHNKVKANVITQDYEDGGCKMCDINIMSKVQQLKWIQRFFDDKDASWKCIFSNLMKPLDIRCFLMSSFRKKDIPTVSEFYKEMLETLYKYRQIPDTPSEIRNENIWYNRYIIRGSSTLYSKQLIELGIIKLQNIVDAEGNLLTFDNLPFEVKSKTNFLYWNGLLKAIPKTWIPRLKIETTVLTHSTVPLNIKGPEKDLALLNIKSLYSELLKQKITTSRSVQHFTEKYNIDEITWKRIYKLPYDLKLNNRVKEFQYKIIHGYLATNLLLYKMKIVSSPRCNFCDLYSQSIQHMFFECLPIRNIWYQLERKILNVTNRVISFCEKDILFGIVLQREKEFYGMVNRVIFYSKYYVYRCKIQNEEVTYEKLLAYIIIKCQLCNW